MPRASTDDDPFWDSWEEEPSVFVERQNRTSSRRTNTKRNAIVAAPSDPFGLDGFGDTWEYKNKPVTLASDDDDPPPQEDFTSAEFDWGTTAACRRQDAEAAEAKRKKEQEEWLSRTTKMAEAKARAEAAAATAEAKAKAAAEAKLAAAEKWQQKVKQATDCVALADPAQALKILHSLSVDNVAIHIDAEKKKHVSQMYAALLHHYEFQHFLSATFPSNPSYLHSQSSNETDKTTSGESTIGDSDREANCDKDISSNTTEVVNRLSSCCRSSCEIDETSSDASSTIGGGTLKVNRLSIDYHSNTEGSKERHSEIETIRGKDWCVDGASSVSRSDS